MGRIAPNVFGGARQAVQVFVKKPEPDYFKEISVLKDVFGGL